MARKRARRKPIVFADLMAVDRISQPAVSPDGEKVVYTTSRHDSKKNAVRTMLRILDLETRQSRVLTPGPGNHDSAAWSPDGSKIAFASNRDDGAGRQLWVLPMDGGEAKCITSGYGGAGAPVWAPDSKRILFRRTVIDSPHFRPRRGEEVDPTAGPSNGEIYGLANEKSSARVADELLFRHWDQWRDRRRNHLFIVDSVTGAMSDVTPHPCDSPPVSLGSERDYDWSPDGREIAFVMNPDLVVARSTNNSIFVQAIGGVKAKGELRCISVTDACDVHPRYTPDGSAIFYLGMEEPGYEADKLNLKAWCRKTGGTGVWLDRFDRSPSMNFEFQGAESVIFLAQDRGRQSIYKLDLFTHRVRQLTLDTFQSMCRVIPGSEKLLVARESATEPGDFFLLTPGKGIGPFLPSKESPERLPADAGATVEQLTDYRSAVDHVQMNGVEDFWYEGAGRRSVHGFLIRPPQFRQGRKYPLIVLIHGGPQSAFVDHFHFRWNYQMFAAQGAMVAILNPRGSTGYGKTFTDQISGDWGGRCYRDLMNGVDYVLRRWRKSIDRKRTAAAGASFGGFMVNWIAGHTNRFRALVCHDGIFQAETMAYTTEELWFEEHEHGGMPHVNRESVLKFSPHLHAKNFRTPTLVVHGEQDFRCPMSEGLAMFTALQTQNVPSRFLHFPDEGHWVLKPANSEVWYDEVVGWLMKWIKK